MWGFNNRVTQHRISEQQHPQLNLAPVHFKTEGTSVVQYVGYCLPVNMVYQ
jgi:hypothetical protein